MQIIIIGGIAMERKEYEECKIEVIAFEASDVIVTSDFDTELLGGN